MEGPCAIRFFRQFFLHSTYKPTKHTPRLACHVGKASFQKRAAGTYSSRRRKNEEAKEDAPWIKRPEVLPQARLEEFSKYDMTTAEELRSKRRRPKRTRMLMRDFIDDSLYNPGYGYFSDQATIFRPGEPFDFPAMQDEAEFYRILGERYTTFEDDLDAKEQNDTRQLWHTPTELFRPHYAEAMARYMVTNYKISSIYPWHDLIIYELGAGNGTFMLNVLDYIRDTDPDVYDRTQYKIIEISPALASLQTSRLTPLTTGSHTHASKVEIINRSIFTWDQYISSPCFFLALEVIDNFAHDQIRYSPDTESPLQSNVLISDTGEFYETYSPDIDPVAARFFRVRDAACEFAFTHPLRWSRMVRGVRRYLPFAPNLSEPEWIPTRLMQFFDVLQKYFPAHKLLLSDFHSLPNALPGVNAPVVQTRYKRRTVPVSTPLVSSQKERNLPFFHTQKEIPPTKPTTTQVRQGYFDILFPTDFAVMSSVYSALTGKFGQVLTHGDFMGRWAYTGETTTANGDNPLLSWYQNASVMTTV